jgi:hypothetical protein
MGGSRAHHRAPDRRLVLSLFRTPSPLTSVKFHLAVTAPAIAVVAAVAGSAGVWSTGAAARPAAIVRPAGPARQARSDVARLIPAPSARPTGTASAARPARNQVQLDALLAVAAAPKGTVLSGGISKGATKARRTPRQIAISLLHKFGWSKRQYRYLNWLWARESSWNVHAENLYSGAYGIPQAVPGAKMASAGPYWRSSAHTQILWGLRYIKGRYGSPAAAWDHELATGWY